MKQYFFANRILIRVYFEFRTNKLKILIKSSTKIQSFCLNIP